MYYGAARLQLYLEVKYDDRYDGGETGADPDDIPAAIRKWMPDDQANAMTTDEVRASYSRPLPCPHRPVLRKVALQLGCMLGCLRRRLLCCWCSSLLLHQPKVCSPWSVSDVA